MTGRRLEWRYVEKALKGDHICYISNQQKFKKHYRNWRIMRSLDATVEEIMTPEPARHRAVPTW